MWHISKPWFVWVCTHSINAAVKFEIFLNKRERKQEVKTKSLFCSFITVLRAIKKATSVTVIMVLVRVQCLIPVTRGSNWRLKKNIWHAMHKTPGTDWPASIHLMVFLGNDITNPEMLERSTLLDILIKTMSVKKR